MPINTSNNPNITKNKPGDINGMVFERSEMTIGLAGLAPRTFKIPNQKKIKKIAKRERGSEIFLKK